MSDRRRTDSRCSPGRSAPARARPRRGSPTRACGPAVRCSTRQRGHRLEQLLRARHRKARRERGAQAAVGAAVPAPGHRQALVDRLLRLARADGAAPRHRRPSCICRRPPSAPWAPAPRTPHPYRARSPSSARWSCPLQQLGRGQLRGGAERRGRVRRLHRPDPRAQPVEQREIVGVAAKQRLTEMDVGLDEPRQQVAAVRVDRCDRRGRPEVRPHRLDAPVLESSTSPSTMSKASFIVRIAGAANRMSRRWRGRHFGVRTRHLWPPDFRRHPLQRRLGELSALPRRMAISSAAMLTAIS